MILDASAILAFLQGEPGADRVERELPTATVGAANWSEVAQKVTARGVEWAIARETLLSFGLRVEPVTAFDAEHAAALWHRGTPLALADRLCLATAERLGQRVLTADRAWGDGDIVEQLR